MTKLINDLKSPDGSPADSEGLEQVFHSHGVNMRYLGFVRQKITESEDKPSFLLDYLEREVALRSFKHVINEWMRDNSELFTSEVIAHCFNLLLAPAPFLD